MRLRLVHVVPLLALAVSACAGPRARTVAMQPTPMQASDLDARMYGAPQPQSYAVRQATRAVPVAEAMAACVILDHLMLDRAQTGGVRGTIG